MKRKSLAVALCLSAPMAGLWVAGCGDDEVFRETDASTSDGGAATETGPITEAGSPDTSTSTGCGNATGSPQRLLLSINNNTTSELAAFNVADKKVDGRYTYPGFIGLTSSLNTDPYLMEQATDVIARLDAKKPWEVVSSWSVAGDDKTDGGAAYADPTAVVVPDCTKGYVLRYNRNKIAVIDTNKVGDASAADSYIDLASLVQPSDTDGLVDMTSAVYVASKKRLYVLLGNNDRTKVTPLGVAFCSDSKPSIIAIDTTTSQLVALGGTAPGGGIALEGYGTAFGSSLVYDAARDRLVVLSTGCNTDAGGGAAGPLVRRRVEEVDLATKAVKTLLPLETEGYPAGMVFIDGTRAVISFFGQSFLWNPTQTTLGPEIPGGFDFATHDGKGNVVGARATYLLDGGAGPIEVVSVPYGDGGGVDASSVVKLGENPFTNNGGFMSGAEMWPRP